MAKSITFTTGKISFQGSIIKVDRDKVYGYTEEIVKDMQGHPCVLGGLLDDGVTLVLSGSTALKTLDEQNREVDKKSLKAVYLDGKDAILIPSSYEQDVQLEPAGLDDVFNLEVTAVYQLDLETASLPQSDILKAFEENQYYRFVFNYRADYEGADAIMLATDQDIFILTGRSLKFDYLENSTKLLVVEEQEGQDIDQNIDFGML